VGVAGEELKAKSRGSVALHYFGLRERVHGGSDRLKGIRGKRSQGKGS